MESRPCHTEHSADRHQRETFPQRRQGTASPPQTARSCQQRTACPRRGTGSPMGPLPHPHSLHLRQAGRVFLQNAAGRFCRPSGNDCLRMANLRPRVCRMASRDTPRNLASRCSFLHHSHSPRTDKRRDARLRPAPQCLCQRSPLEEHREAAQDLRLRPRPHGSLHDRLASRLPLPME